VRYCQTPINAIPRSLLPIGGCSQLSARQCGQYWPHHYQPGRPGFIRGTLLQPSGYNRAPTLEPSDCARVGNSKDSRPPKDSRGSRHEAAREPWAALSFARTSPRDTELARGSFASIVWELAARLVAWRRPSRRSRQPRFSPSVFLVADMVFQRAGAILSDDGRRYHGRERGGPWLDLHDPVAEDCGSCEGRFSRQSRSCRTVSLNP
jgi:hypothetical protein